MAGFGHRDERLARRARRLRFGLRNPRDGRHHLFLHLVGVGPHVQLELDFVGNHVGLRAAVDRSDRDHDRVHRVVLARDDRLQRHHRARRHHDGVDRVVGHRAVAAAAEQRERRRNRHRAERPGMNPDRPGGHRVIVMDADHEVRLREALEEAVLEHRCCAAAGAGGFLGRLADEHQRPVPLLAMIDHPPRRAGPCGHVEVVAARMHHRHGDAGEVLHHRRARKRHAGLLGDGQRIELRAQHHGGPGAVLQQRHDARPADAGGHVEAERLQPGSQLRRRLHFLEGELRVAMDVLVERLEIGIVGVDVRAQRRRRLGAKRRGGQQRRGNNGDVNSHVASLWQLIIDWAPPWKFEVRSGK